MPCRLLEALGTGHTAPRIRRAGFFKWYAEMDVSGLPGHPPRYTASLGPYRTRRGALEAADDMRLWATLAGVP